MRGRPPKHPELRLIHGSKRSKRAATVQAKGEPQRPAFLKGRARKIWEETVPQAPWLTSLDSACLSVWCHLGAEIEELGSDCPASRISIWRQLANDLGLSMSGRLRIPATAARDEDPREAAIARKYLGDDPEDDEEARRRREAAKFFD